MTMLEQRVIEWINADIDGELSPEDQVSLQAVLDSSEEARAMKAEFLRLANLLENVPDVSPPEGLTEAVLDRLSPQSVERFSLIGLLGSMRPATAGLAFASGLLATIAFYELSPDNPEHMDTSSMVGTMVAGQPGQNNIQLDSLSLEQAGISGTITLQQRGDIFVLNFDLDSEQTTEIEISLAEAGLSFGGIAHAPGNGDMTVDSIKISGGNLSVVDQGRQAFFIFLSDTAKDSGRGKELSIGISAGGAQVFTGVLRA